MTWSDVYLICFLVGLALSALSFLGGTHLHLSHAVGHHAGFAGGHHGGGRGTTVSRINFATITAFLAWFGGTGYLLSLSSGASFPLVFIVASASGLTGAAVVFWFVAKVLWSPDENLDPADYDMVGVLGRITNPIRSGGTGEIVFSQQGTRRTAGARSEDHHPIGKGTEVVVTRYENGIAYVRPWDSVTGPGEPIDHDR
jgi:membrane protein implicated in regulation of membrane protease activity